MAAGPVATSADETDPHIAWHAEWREFCAYWAEGSAGMTQEYRALANLRATLVQLTGRA